MKELILVTILSGVVMVAAAYYLGWVEGHTEGTRWFHRNDSK